MKFLIVLILAVIVCSPLNAFAQIVSNGDFSANGAAFVNYPGYISVNAAIPNWTDSDNTRTGINSQTQSPFAPSGYYSSGDPPYFALLQNGGTTLSQTINLTAGTEYTLSFVSAPRANNPGGNIGIAGAVEISNSDYNSGLAYETVAANNIIGSDFTTTTVNFLAAGSGMTTLTLENISTSGDQTMLFSNISIIAAPEPSTWALILGGLGLGILLKRRSRRV